MSQADAHRALIHRFYEAFSQRDAAAMSACYHPDVHFTDPVFPDLKGFEAAAMWHMLCEQGKDLRIEHSQVDADDGSGTAHWDAFYTFGGKHKVENRIDAAFTFQDGRIIRHVDTFDLRRWSGMALGLPGKLFGWAPMLHDQVRKQANVGLRRYIKKNNVDASLIPPL